MPAAAADADDAADAAAARSPICVRGAREFSRRSNDRGVKALV